MNPSRKSAAVMAVTLLAVLALTAPCHAGPIWDWLFGKAPNMTAQTTYTPPYIAATPVAPPIVTVPAAPAVTYGSCAPACGSCAPACGTCAPSYGSCAPGCGSCAPQVCQYAPYVSYRPVYQSVQVAAYRPVALWTQLPRLTQYTTYRPVLAAVPIVAYSPVCTACPAPCVNYGCPSAVGYGVPAPSCNSCASAIPTAAPQSSYPLGTSTGMSSTSVPSTSVPPKTFVDPPSNPPPTPVTTPSTNSDKSGDASAGAASDSVYQQKTSDKGGPEFPKNSSETPAEGNQILPIPQLNSLPSPQRSAADDRLTANPHPARVRQVAMPTASSTEELTGWHAVP
ncbi:MAG: hypothetical protein JXB10_04965 [Pirellulales bacterium]|nr:hypothetical protein [Pirellulales bacterium]